MFASKGINKTKHWSLQNNIGCPMNSILLKRRIIPRPTMHSILLCRPVITFTIFIWILFYLKSLINNVIMPIVTRLEQADMSIPTFGNRCLSAIGGEKQRSRLAGLVQLSAEAAPGPIGVPPSPPGPTDDNIDDAGNLHEQLHCDNILFFSVEVFFYPNCVLIISSYFFLWNFIVCRTSHSYWRWDKSWDKSEGMVELPM